MKYPTLSPYYKQDDPGLLHTADPKDLHLSHENRSFKQPNTTSCLCPHLLVSFRNATEILLTLSPLLLCINKLSHYHKTIKELG